MAPDSPCPPNRTPIISWRHGALSAHEQQGIAVAKVRAVTKMIVFLNSANVITIVLLATAVLPASVGLFRPVWAGLGVLVGVNSVQRCLRHTLQPERPTTDRDGRQLLREATAFGLLWAVLPCYCLATLSPDRQTVLIATVAGVMGAGAIALTASRSMNLAFVGQVGVGLLVALLHQADGHFRLLAYLLVLYLAALVLGLLTQATSFELRCLAEIEADRERQTVSLLLDDYEGGARDWLWQTNADGRLTRLPARVAGQVGNPDLEHRHLSLAGVLGDLGANDSPEGAMGLRLLAEHLAGSAPFREVVVPVQVDGVERIWSLSAKPEHDGGGQVRGWHGVGSDITDDVRQRDEIVRLANVDSLTGLANRRQFSQRLDELIDARPTQQEVSLAIIDLDNFKSVNDTLGHHVGDQLLVAVADRFSSVCRRTDLCARLGGDEFAVVMNHPTGFDPAVRIQEMLATLAEPFAISGTRLEIHASAGIAGLPQNAARPQELLIAADLALYAAKEAGRNRLRRFDPDLCERASVRATAIHDLGRALHAGEFEVHYQPQVRLATDRVEGFEALLRWWHPDKGLISTIDFIQVAEETGLMIPIGADVLARACADAVTWPDHLRVAVNVSPTQLRSSGLVETVVDTLAASGLPARRLQLEVTESAVVGEQAVAVLDQIRHLGVSIAIDDFGTGYSSFATLRTLPLDQVKIDRSFITPLAERPNQQARAIVEAIISVARALDLDTVAEGVEHPSQRSLLELLGCGLSQGFLEAGPLRAHEVAGYLDQRRPGLDVAQGNPRGRLA